MSVKTIFATADAYRRSLLTFFLLLHAFCKIDQIGPHANTSPGKCVEKQRLVSKVIIGKKQALAILVSADTLQVDIE